MPCTLKIITSFKAALDLLSLRKRANTNGKAHKKVALKLTTNDVSSKKSLFRVIKSNTSVDQIEKLITEKTEENFRFPTLPTNSETIFGLPNFDIMSATPDEVFSLSDFDDFDSCSLISSGTISDSDESNLFSCDDSESSISTLISQLEIEKEDQVEESLVTVPKLITRGATAPPKSDSNFCLGDLKKYVPCEYTSKFDKPSQLMYQSLDRIKEESELYISLFSLSERSRKLQSQMLISLKENKSEDNDSISFIP